MVPLLKDTLNDDLLEDQLVKEFFLDLEEFNVVFKALEISV